jgi:hypothetical protein
MVDSRTFDGQIQLVEYVPRVLHAQPSRLEMPSTFNVYGSRGLAARPPSSPTIDG